MQSETSDPQGMWKQVKNHVGQVCVKLLYDTGDQKRITILLDSTKTPPEIGDTVTWDSKSYTCEGARHVMRILRSLNSSLLRQRGLHWHENEKDTSLTSGFPNSRG